MTRGQSFASLSLSDTDRRALKGLLDELEEKHEGAIIGVLLYGSCLRSGDIHDGLVDLYLLCESYREAYRGRRLALANALLPPNVFYAEHAHAGGILRSKVSVVSLSDFSRACSEARFESYFWGRFAQPVALLRVRDADSQLRIAAALQSAAQTLLTRSLPCLPEAGTLNDLWTGALHLSYTTELRTEKAGRARELVEAAADSYLAATEALARRGDLPLVVDRAARPPRYRCELTSWQRRRSRLAWTLRRGLGKTLSIARLVKALFTFRGGLDYIVWKLERHSGERIEVPPNVRRYPLLFAWPFFWRLYRRGIFR
jgi:hypothetical protein